MDGGPAPPPSYSAATPEIPTDIFQPLLKIAQLGYDANDIRHYYLTMLRHLRRMGTENAEAAYTLVTPISERKLPFSSDDDSSSARPTTESVEDHVSPKTVPTGWSWSRSASYEPSIQEQNDLVASSAASELFDLSPEQLQPQHLQMQPPEITPTQQSFQQGGHDRQHSVMVLPAHYSDPRATRSQFDVNDLNASSEHLAFPRAQSNQWFGPDDFTNIPHPHPQTQFAAPWPSMLQHQSPYQLAMSNTQMPLLVPYAQGPPAMHHPPQPQRSFTESFADELMNPFSNGGLSQLATELYHSPFFPTIDVIPSRKRRKVLKTGVKRIAQTLGTARQASV
jgi:hypothetical protein